MTRNELPHMQDYLRAVTRRHFFKEAGLGVGATALTMLINRSLFGADLPPQSEPSCVASSAATKTPQFAPKAKSIIYLFMAGAPSQLDLLDCKPALQQLDGQPIPESVVKGERFAFIRGVPKLLGSPYQF